MHSTRRQIINAATVTLLRTGYAGLSLRRIADEAGVGVGHIHYHFRSKRNLVLAVLEDQNQQRLARQREMFGSDEPLWKQWEQACDFLEDDLQSGYVRVLQEMIAASWSDPEVAEHVRAFLRGWHELLTDVTRRAADRFGGLGPFAPDEIAALAGDAFLGAEALMLLGLDDGQGIPHRAALRRVGELIREHDLGG